MSPLYMQKFFSKKAQISPGFNKKLFTFPGKTSAMIILNYWILFNWNSNCPAVRGQSDMIQLH